jgi:hypothetical protein
MASRQTDVMSDDDDDEGITCPTRNADTLAPSVSSPADVPGLAKRPAAKRARPVFEELCGKPHRRVSKAGSSANSSGASRRALAWYHADWEPVDQDLHPASLSGRQTKLKSANANARMKCKFCSEVRPRSFDSHVCVSTRSGRKKKMKKIKMCKGKKQVQVTLLSGT